MNPASLNVWFLSVWAIKHGVISLNTPLFPSDTCPPGPMCPSLLTLLPSMVINVPLSHIMVLEDVLYVCVCVCACTHTCIFMCALHKAFAFKNNWIVSYKKCSLSFKLWHRLIKHRPQAGVRNFTDMHTGEMTLFPYQRRLGWSDLTYTVLPTRRLFVHTT